MVGERSADTDRGYDRNDAPLLVCTTLYTPRPP